MTVVLAGKATLDDERCVHFYEQDFYCLSNFSSFRLMWGGIDFDTLEHAYHFQKFRELFDDSTNEQRRIRGAIMHARSAHDAFKLAEVNRQHQRSDWNAVKVDVMQQLIRAKVKQHAYVHRKLLDTGTRILIENSWRDDFWGWGPQRDGQNMLGRCWMALRSELQLELDGGQR
jgi:ribA/ribD-fused uncharacterized protein